MKVIETPLKGLLLIEPRMFGDERGYFFESYQKERYAEAGITRDFVQDNTSRSARNVLRGLHFQVQYPQGKLVCVTRGSVFDVAVDARPGSQTFGHWYGVVLDDVEHRQLYVPPGFAHGFCVLSDTADFMYKCTDYYDPGDEGGVLWNDPDIGVDWPVRDPIINARDMNFPRLKDLPSEKLPRVSGVE